MLYSLRVQIKVETEISDLYLLAVDGKSARPPERKRNRFGYAHLPVDKMNLTLI